MKLQFTSKDAKIAASFANHLKAERSLASTTTVSDKGIHTVEYSIADCCVPTKEPCSPTYADLSNVVSYVLKEMQYQNNWLSSQISYLSEQFYQHSKGHLPPIMGAEKMENALKTLGVGGDYEVRKPVLYSQASLRGGIEVDFPHAK